MAIPALLRRIGSPLAREAERTDSGLTVTEAEGRGRSDIPSAALGESLSGVVLWAGVATLAAPALWALFRKIWGDEQGQFAILTVALGLYFLWRERPEQATSNPPLRLAAILFVLGGAGYLLSRVAGELLLQAYSLGLTFGAVYVLLFGLAQLQRAWLGIFYLALSIPPPFTLVWRVSAILRMAIAKAVVAVVGLAGVPVGRDGLSLFVGGHRLDVAQACSGLHSLISLSAVALAYIELRRRPTASYLLAALPIVFFLALTANFTRVLALVLATLELGERLAQSWLHQAAGLILFGIAVGGVIALDAAFGARIASRPSVRLNVGT